MENINSKKCSKCGETKLLLEFNKDKRKKLGLRYDCKTYQKKHNDMINKKKKNIN